MSHRVSVRRLIDAPPAAVWNALTSTPLLAQWFGDVELRPRGGAFRIEFGDGDFFAGEVRRRVAQRELGLSWRFMDVGPQFEVTFMLEGCGEGTALTVTDAGALLASEAESLEQARGDFLDRLARFLSTGQRVRYRWSPAISAGALLPEDVQPSSLLTDGWLRAHFGHVVELASSLPTRLVLRFHDPAWNGRVTEASLAWHPVAGATYVLLVHEGWDALPPGSQIAERRRYAAKWSIVLGSLESVTVAR